MEKYISLFRMKFNNSLQYRGAAIAGMFAQLGFGIMEVLLFRAFYRSQPEAFPMTFQATVSYIWLQQAFLVYFMGFSMENDMFYMIQNGDISYELCRPIKIYDLWFVRSLGHRMAGGMLRSIPLLVISLFVPSPYGLVLPQDLMTCFWFLITLILGILVTVSLCMLIYMLAFFTISPIGLRMCFVSLCDLLTGALIPLPFFPKAVQSLISFLPFAYMQNIPLRIYSMDIQGVQLYQSVGLQIFWIIALVGIGKAIGTLAMKKVTVLGG